MRKNLSAEEIVVAELGRPTATGEPLIGAKKLGDMWQSYKKGNSWRCKKSPTKAHYWQESKHGGETSEFTCKHCETTRKMRNTWSGQMQEVAKKLKIQKAMDIDIRSEETHKKERVSEIAVKVGNE